MSGRDRFESWTAMPVEIGELVALMDDGITPLVIDPTQPEATARQARSVVDLHAAHIGCKVVLMFEGADAMKPIVMGVLRDGEAERSDQVDVEADGQRMIVSAQQQLVLRCGKASITLTKAGKVLIEGSYLLSKSTGVNRIKGGSVQLN
jgi:hypothetical protein